MPLFSFNFCIFGYFFFRKKLVKGGAITPIALPLYPSLVSIYVSFRPNFESCTSLPCVGYGACVRLAVRVQWKTAEDER